MQAVFGSIIENLRSLRASAQALSTDGIARLCRVLGVSPSGFFYLQHHQPGTRARTELVAAASALSKVRTAA